MVTFSITHQISSSKGWGRYCASVDGVPVIQSATGNAWVSAGHSADIVDGTVVVATLQTQESTKNGRKNTQTDTYRVVAKAGATAILGYWNGLEVTVSGAERA